LESIKLSANWMASCGTEGQDGALYDTVQSVSELCQTLNISIPVGKDSLSMKMSWEENGQTTEVVSPVSLVVSAFAPVKDVRRTLTPVLSTEDKTVLIHIDLSEGKQRLAGSVLSQILQQYGNETPDLD